MQNLQIKESESMKNLKIEESEIMKNLEIEKIENMKKSEIEESESMKNLEIEESEIIGYISLSKKDYIKMKLEYYINSITTLDPFTIPSNEYLINKLVMDYILNNFSMDELWLFYTSQVCYTMRERIITENKAELIGKINRDFDMSEQEKKRLKKKVWNMPKVLFGLISHLIHVSNLFYDVENECLFYPDLGRVKCIAGNQV